MATVSARCRGDLIETKTRLLQGFALRNDILYPSFPPRRESILVCHYRLTTSSIYHLAMLSNEIKDPIKALEIYRNKDLEEKAFGNLKERLNFNRTAVSSDQSLDGKLFVEFLALIYLSYIQRSDLLAE